MAKTELWGQRFWCRPQSGASIAAGYRLIVKLLRRQPFGKLQLDPPVKPIVNFFLRTSEQLSEDKVGDSKIGLVLMIQKTRRQTGSVRGPLSIREILCARVHHPSGP
jgi:hypothetical protein